MYQKNEAYIDTNWDTKEKIIMLPHSCDEWWIGGKEDAQLLIEDLQNLIKQLK